MPARSTPLRGRSLAVPEFEQGGLAHFWSNANASVGPLEHAKHAAIPPSDGTQRKPCSQTGLGEVLQSPARKSTPNPFQGKHIEFDANLSFGRGGSESRRQAPSASARTDECGENQTGSWAFCGVSATLERHHCLLCARLLWLSIALGFPAGPRGSLLASVLFSSYDSPV